MNEELTLAIDELRERPSNRTWFIPVLINDIAIPSRPISRVEDLSDIQAVRLYENWNDNVRRILHVIKHDDPVSARIDFLVNVLQSPVHGERLYALQQLHAIGPDAAEAVPILTRVLKDPNGELRGRAADALRDIGPAAADAVPALTEALKDATLRWRAAVALQRIGPAAVPALAEALKDQDALVRSLAADALKSIREKP